MSRAWALGIAVMFATVPAIAGPIELWTRAKGDHSQGGVPRERVVTYRFDEKDLTEREGVDPQYDETSRRRYRGVSLSWLLGRYGVSERTNLALLHFENGMVIPLPLGAATLERVDAFLAHSVWTKEPDGQSGWSTDFPDILKPGAGMRDRRPIRFHGNKLVVASTWHPLVSHERGALFSPWLHADSLTGIELVQSDAYYRQFQVGSTSLAKGGYAIFLGRCQYCHGARSVGATFGWDFVEPVPLYTYRGPKNLFLHVRYREGDAPERGLMMPALKDLTEKDAEGVWQWLKDLSDKPMPPYEPPATGG